MKKKSYRILGLLTLLFAFNFMLFVSCSDEINNPNGSGDSISYIINNSTVNTWVDSIDNTWVQVIVEIQNTGTVPIYLSSGSYDLENSEGLIIAHESYVSVSPQVLEVGEKGYMYDTTILDDPVSGNLTVIPHISTKKATVDSIRYPVTEVSLSDTSYGDIKAVGRIENTTGVDEDSIIYVVVVLLDSENQPLGVLTDIIVDDFLADTEIGFEATTLTMPPSITTSNVESYRTYSFPYAYQLW
jgi:hypothetical protein